MEELYSKIFDIASQLAESQNLNTTMCIILMYDYLNEFGKTMIDEVFDEKDLQKRHTIIEKYRNISNSKIK